MVHEELTDDEAELIKDIRTAKQKGVIHRLLRRGEFGLLIVEWNAGGVNVKLTHSVNIK
jgi:hypothetical protein